MDEIEQIQKEIGEFLVDMVSIPWESICFWVNVKDGCYTYWFCLKEKKTNEVCTYESFFTRYVSYPYSKREINHRLFIYADNLYNAYLEKYGSSNVWDEMIFIVEETGCFHIDFVYDSQETSVLKRRNSILSKYYGVEYKYLREKYR